MTMSPEAEFNSDVLHVLQKIKKEILSTETGKPVEFRLTTVIAAGYPSKREELQILKKLAEWGAVKLVGLLFDNWDYPRKSYSLEILQPKFDEVYQKYEDLNKPQSEKIEPKGVAVLPNSQQTEKLWGLLDNLKRQHDSFVGSSEREFFLGVADYIKFIVDTPDLEKIAQEIKKQQAEDETKIVELEKLVRQEVEQVAEELDQIIKDNKIDDEGVKDAAQAYIDVKEGRIQSSSTMEEALWGEVAGIIRAIRDTSNKNLVDKFIEKFPDNDNIAGYTFSEHYDEYEAELKRFRDKRKTSLWGSWDSLVLVYLVVHKFDEEAEKLDPIKDIWRRMNFIGLHGEMQEVLNGSQKPRIQFVQTEYKTHLNRVHSYFTKRLEEELPILQIVKDARTNALETLANFQFPVIEIPKPVLVDIERLNEQTNALVKSYQSLTSLADTLNSIKMTVPDLSGIAKSMQFGSKLIEQMQESQKLLSGPILPSKFVDIDYQKRAEEAEIRKLQLLKLRREIDSDHVNLEIERWLSIKDERSLNRIWRVVRALNYEWELRDQDSFKIPHDKFEMHKITHPNDLEAILINLHNRKFIFISRKVAEQPPSDDPANKPGGMQLWQPVTEDPAMIRSSDAQVEIFPTRFILLVKVLRGLMMGDQKQVQSEELEDEHPKQQSDDKNFLASYKLIFTPNDGITHYRGADYQFTGKAKALLVFLNSSKNTPFSLDEIKSRCNPNISNTRSYFKGDKDMRDAVNYIKKCLKVNKGEYFPIHKQNDNWIWVEK